MDLTTGSEDEEMTPRQSHMPLPPPLGANLHNTNSTSPPLSPEPHLSRGSNTEQQTTHAQMEQDESGPTDPGINATGGGTHVSTGYTNGLVPLMEYRQSDLISREILVGFYLSVLSGQANKNPRNTFGSLVWTLSVHGQVSFPSPLL
jgi:hypothetical protein